MKLLVSKQLGYFLYISPYCDATGVTTTYHAESKSVGQAGKGGVRTQTTLRLGVVCGGGGEAKGQGGHPAIANILGVRLLMA